MNKWINNEGRKGRKSEGKKRTKMKVVGSEAEEDSVYLHHVEEIARAGGSNQCITCLCNLISLN